MGWDQFLLASSPRESPKKLVPPRISILLPVRDTNMPMFTSIFSLVMTAEVVDADLSLNEVDRTDQNRFYAEIRLLELVLIFLIVALVDDLAKIRP